MNPPPQVILAIIGLDQHEVGSLSVARLLADAGMEVVYLGRFNTPATVVSAALSEDVDVVGVSCHSWEFLEFSDELISLLRPHPIPVVFGGSVLTPRDAELLRAKGAAACFGARSTRDEIVEGVRRCALEHRAALEGSSAGGSAGPNGPSLPREAWAARGDPGPVPS